MMALPTFPADVPLSRLDVAFAQTLQTAQPSADTRHHWLAALVSHQYGRGHACLDLETLATKGVSVLGWEPPWQSTIPHTLREAASSMPWIQGDASPLVLEDARLYLRRNWQAEHSIKAAIRQRLAQPCEVPANWSASLHGLFPKTGLDTQAHEPDWQKIACALAGRRRLTLITGGPGTGKTTTVVRLLAALQADPALQGQALRIELAAPTGKAAARLSESIAHSLQHLPEHLRLHIPLQASTLHKLLGVRRHTVVDPKPHLQADLVVVDEASMIDLEMMARLLAVVPASARLVLLGDKDQLASVEAGAVMGQLCAQADNILYDADTREWIEAMTGETLPPSEAEGSPLAQQTVTLRRSRRFTADSGIGRWALAVKQAAQRCADVVAGPATELAIAPAQKGMNDSVVDTMAQWWQDTPDWPGSQGGVSRLVPRAPQDPVLMDLLSQGWSAWLTLLRSAQGQVVSNPQARELLHAFGQFQVLCAVREGPWGTLAINQRIVRHWGWEGLSWYPGRPVMVTRNDHTLGLMNGDVGLCLNTAKGLRVAFAVGPDDVRWVQPARLDAVEDVFAMTVHKSQGSEFDTVCLMLPDQPSPVLTAELIYTGITRARQRLVLVAKNPAVLFSAVKQRVERAGGLML